MTALAFLFPGQGSQSVSMMAGFDSMTLVRDTFIEASDILGVDFWRMITTPNENLNETIHTQPLMLSAGVATWRAWCKLGYAQPHLLAGHSLGEYTALVVAQVLSFEQALPLVRYRAQIMQDTLPAETGAMAAILGLEVDKVRALCLEGAQGEVLEAVNLNAPGQVVIAGHRSALERGIALMLAAGAKRALRLAVSVPSHCTLMRPAAVELDAYLQDLSFGSPQIPVFHNVDVLTYTESVAIKNALVRQLYSPVRWIETVQAMVKHGAMYSAECGPGKVLAGLNKRIVAEQPCSALTSLAEMEVAQHSFNGGCA